MSDISSPDSEAALVQKLASQQDAPLSPALENYLIIIFRLEFSNGVCRASDLAAAAGVTRSSVTSALRMLSRLGYIQYSPYKLINLTEKGIQAGEKLAHKQLVLQDFFHSILQLPDDVVQRTACALEHCMPDEAMLRLRQFVMYMHEKEDQWKHWHTEFQDMKLGLLQKHKVLRPDDGTPAVRHRQHLLQNDQ